MESCRVFISYSHGELELVKQIVQVLEENGLVPLWDHHLASGQGFGAQIKAFIEHSHVFLPVITAESSERGWVHQEIGYATALRIPTLPVCKERLPGEMLQSLQAVHIGDDYKVIKSKLTLEVFEDLVRHASQESQPLFECAISPEHRSLTLARYADHVQKISVNGVRSFGCVRQKAALGTFCTPNKRLNHPLWTQREGKLPRSEHRRDCQRKEREALEKHARIKGCRLILSPELNYDERHGPGATFARLQTLVEFLESDEIPKEKVEVAMSTSDSPHSFTIVGDWFSAEAFAGKMGIGYHQTMFTRHAATIWRRREAFDQEFFELLEESRVSPESSRERALDVLKTRMEELPRSS